MPLLSEWIGVFSAQWSGWDIGVFTPVSQPGTLFFYVPVIFGQHDLLMAIARWHHGETVFQRQHFHVQEEGAVMSQAALQSRIQLIGVLHAFGFPAKGARRSEGR